MCLCVYVGVMTHIIQLLINECTSIYVCVCVGVCDAYASTTTCAKHMQILFEFSCLFVLWLLLLLLFG